MDKKVKLPLWVVVVLISIVAIVLLYLICSIISDYKDELKYRKIREIEYSEITYDIPSEFESNDELKSYSYNDNSAFCHIYFYASDKYINDFKEWFKGNITSDLSKEVSEIKEIEINGKKAYYVEIKDNKTTEHVYGIESTNYFYSVSYYLSDYKYKDRDDIDTNLCFTSENKIINSINVK